MRVTLFARVFFICTLVSIFIFVNILKNQIKIKNENTGSENNNKERGQEIAKAISKEILKDASEELSRKKAEQGSSKENNLKYILRWTSSKSVPFVYMGEGQQGFIDRNCPYINCFVTGDRNYFGDYTKFDVIAFSGPEVIRMSSASLPTRRSPHQKFAFASIESADNYPVCSNVLDGFFNWTWTYRLDSEAKWGYIVVRDKENKIVGPRTEMHWIKFEDMDPVSEELKEKIKTKTKAAAWFVSNCYSKSGRERFVKQLQNELKKYDLTVDVYGSCGKLSCPRDKGDECNAMLEKDYYFYLSFENSFSEDYVTEKLLYGLQHTTVPIVYGGANYTRFMPDGIYLNARELGVEKLAAKMKKLIDDPEQYAEYFRWKKYYSYYRRFESLETDDYCRFCSILFEEDLVKQTTIYHNFRQWWDPPNRC